MAAVVVRIVLLRVAGEARSRARRRRARASSTRATAARPSAGSDRGSRNPSPRTRRPDPRLRICSTTLTRSKNERPVDRRQQPHARDHVADGELVGRFALMLDAQQLFGRIALRLERALQRLPGGGRRRGLVAQPLHQLDDERRGQSAVRLDFGLRAADRGPRSTLSAALRRGPSPTSAPARGCAAPRRRRRRGAAAPRRAPGAA